MAEITFYVNTDADSGGNGTTNNTSSGDGTHAYDTIAAFDTNEATNLITATDNYIVLCSGTTGDTTQHNFYAWTCDATYDLVMDGQNPGPAADTSKYTMSRTITGDGNTNMNISDTFVTVKNVQVAIDELTYTNLKCFKLNANDGTYENCMAYETTGTRMTGSGNKGFELNFRTGTKISNCVAAGMTIGFGAASNTGLQAKYNTAYDCGTGFSINASSMANDGAFVNNLGADNGTDFSVGTNQFEVDYNCSTDATADDNQTAANGVINATIAFVDAANNDFHLSSGDAVDAGSDRSSDSIYPISLDADGDTRSATPDIGADEILAAPGFEPQWARHSNIILGSQQC